MRFWLVVAPFFYFLFFFIFLERTIQSQQRREFPAVVHSGGVRGARHPEVFIDGGGGDDSAVDGGHLPVTVGQAHTSQHPSQEGQHQRHDFHDRIHDPPLVLGLTVEQEYIQVRVWKRQVSSLPASNRVSEMCKSGQMICIMIYTTRFLLPFTSHTLFFFFFTPLKLNRCLSKQSQGPMVIRLW